MEYRHTLPVDCELIDEFRILGPLGSGGFANTYLAYDLTLGREVAIKEYFPAGLAIRAATERVQVKSESDEKQFRWGLNRFVREAKTLAKFRHPSVVRVFRVFDANDTAYIVLEFVRGANMETWLRSLERRPTQEELDKLLPPLLDALEVVHSAGILHRDIKPANIYIREADRQPVLLDFGAARYAISDVAGTTAAIVSKGYSPHEAYATDARMQGPWTDIYGLAATLYRALAGSAPPESTSRVLVDDCVPLSQSEELIAGYRLEFLAAIDKALSIMPQARPQAIPEWREHLFPGLAPISFPDAASLPGGVAAEWRPISDQPSDATEIVDDTMTSNPVLKRLSSPSYAARIRSGSSSKGTSADAKGRDNAPAGRSAGTGPAGEESGGAPVSPRSALRSGPSHGAASLPPSRSRRVGPPQAPVAAPKSINMSFAAGVILLIGGASILFALGGNGLFSGNDGVQRSVVSSGADRESARAAAEAEARARQERLAILAQREADEARQRAEAARVEAEAEKRRQQEQAAAEKRRLQAEADAKAKAVREAQLRAEAAARRRQEAEAAQAQAREDARKRAEAERARRDREAAAAAEAAAERARQSELERERREKEAAAARAAEAERKRLAEAEAAEQRAREAARKQAEVDRLRREAEAAEARARQEAEAKQAEAERLRLEREAADRRAREDEARRLAEAEQKQREREAAIARRRAEELRSSESERVRLAAQIAEERAKEEERQRLQAANVHRQREVRLAALDTTLRLPTTAERTEYVKKVQTALKANQCYGGEVNGDIDDTSIAMVAAERSLKNDFRRIDLARATSSDYDSWLTWMRDLRSFRCPLVSPDDATATKREQRAKQIDRVRGAKKYRSTSRAKPTPTRTKPKKTYRSNSVSSGGSSRDSLLRSTR